MPARRVAVELPDDSTIRTWKFDEGLSYQQMVDRWYAESGHLATRQAFCMRLGRMGLTEKKPKTSLIPWVLEDRHKNSQHAQMLRYEARRRHGEIINNPKKASNLLFFLSERAAANTVVHYEPNSAQGFWDVEREWFDRDIIRDPRLLSLVGTKAPKTKVAREKLIASLLEVD